MESSNPNPNERGAVDLYWLPLGAGGRCVRINGRIFEALSATIARRDRCDLYHSALEVQLGEAKYVIEMAPVWNERSKDVALSPRVPSATGKPDGSSYSATRSDVAASRAFV